MDIAQLKADLERDEDRRESAYEDSAGYLTIGVGHLIDARIGGRLPDSIIDGLLAYDIRVVMRDLNVDIPWYTRLSEPRQRVLANMTFNLGIEKLLEFKHMLAALKSGDYDRAADEMLDSLWAKQVGDRATRLAAMMRSG